MANQPDGAGAARELRSRALRDSIAQACGDLLSVRGFAGSSIMEIAAAALVSKNQLLHYFSSKEDIACAAVELARSRLRNEIAQPALSLAEPRARLAYAAQLLSAAACLPGGSLSLLAALLRERAVLPQGLAAATGALAAELHGFLRTLCKGLKAIPASAETLEPEAPAAEAAQEPPRARQLASAALAFLLGAATLSQSGGEQSQPLSAELCSQSLQRLLERG